MEPMRDRRARLIVAVIASRMTNTTFGLLIVLPQLVTAAVTYVRLKRRKERFRRTWPFAMFECLLVGGFVAFWLYAWARMFDVGFMCTDDCAGIDYSRIPYETLTSTYFLLSLFCNVAFGGLAVMIVRSLLDSTEPGVR